MRNCFEHQILKQPSPLNSFLKQNIKSRQPFEEKRIKAEVANNDSNISLKIKSIWQTKTTTITNNPLTYNKSQKRNVEIKINKTKIRNEKNILNLLKFISINVKFS
uniref:Uncharacterized protein n=1 Tax=Meloidogyne enterolobii TaxID=390850 RepID=A0A6V7V0A8_MELEN|nr:unnamed protein product [Meloidogyne enterolobii]